MVNTILKSIKNGKSPGNSEAQPEMYNGSTTDLTVFLKIVYEKMINYNIILKDSNVGILQPIVKDSKKNPDDMKNLRPITISDNMANIYEKIIYNDDESCLVIGM